MPLRLSHFVTYRQNVILLNTVTQLAIVPLFTIHRKYHHTWPEDGACRYVETSGSTMQLLSVSGMNMVLRHHAPRLAVSTDCCLV
jgi:hypothetical protein